MIRGWKAASVAALPLLLAAAGLCARLAVSRNSPRNIPILMYHRIGEHADRWSVSPRDFATHMRFLREEGYVGILPSDLAANRAWGKPLPERPVIITLDDGYRDAVTRAEPILKRYGFRAMVYLITGYVGADASKRKQYAGADCLTWDEVRAARRRGVLEFGGHSHTHTPLVRAPDPLAEASRCFQDIARYGGFTPDAFCYPHGMARERTAETVRRAGFSTAVICGDRIAAWGPDADLHLLPRVSAIGGSPAFSATHRREAGSGDRMVVLRYRGASMQVRPCLAPDAPDARRAWLDPVRLDAEGSYELRWPAHAAGGDGRPPARLEIWDSNRILRLYAQAID